MASFDLTTGTLTPSAAPPEIFAAFELPRRVWPDESPSFGEVCERIFRLQAHINDMAADARDMERCTTSPANQPDTAVGVSGTEMSPPCLAL